MNCYGETVLYWKIKELEETAWSGVLSFQKNGENTGRVLFSGGHISWAEGSGQKDNLFKALVEIAQIGKEDLLFAESVFQEKKGKSDFVGILEEYGLVPFWTLRECLRIHINSALMTLFSDETLEFFDNPQLKISASKHVFTLEELVSARTLAEVKSFNFSSIPGLEFIEVRTHNDGAVMRWPDTTTIDNKIDDFWSFEKRFRSKLEDHLDFPEMHSYHFSHAVYLHIPIPDFYRTSLFIRISPSVSFEEAAALSVNYSTLIVMQISNTVIPLKSVTEGAP